MEDTGKLNLLIERIERHQRALDLNDAQFVARYQRFLGSAKTWRDRFCKRDFADMGKSLTTWVRKLESMVAELDGHSVLEEFFDELPFAVKMTAIYDRLQGQHNDRRCGVGLATTGVGKSQWAMRVMNKHPRGTAYSRANESWRNSISQIISGIGKAIGCPIPDFTNPATALNKVIESLKMNPLTVIIDEAHEGGVLLMKLVKTLIDETSSRVILLAFPTTWQKVMSASNDARAEAQQLFGRTLKPVFTDYANGTRKEDVVIFLQKAAGINGESEGIAAQILPLVRTNGNLRLLADAIEEAKLQAEITEKPLDGRIIVAQVHALCPTHIKEVAK